MSTQTMGDPDRNKFFNIPKWSWWWLFGWIWDLPDGWVLLALQPRDGQSLGDQEDWRHIERRCTRDVVHRNELAAPGYGAC